MKTTKIAASAGVTKEVDKLVFIDNKEIVGSYLSVMAAVIGDLLPIQFDIPIYVFCFLLFLPFLLVFFKGVASNSTVFPFLILITN